MGVKVHKLGQPGATDQGWFWELPEGGQIAPKEATIQNLAPFGEDPEPKADSSTTSPKGANSKGMAPFDGTLGVLGDPTDCPLCGRDACEGDCLSVGIHEEGVGGWEGL